MTELNAKPRLDCNKYEIIAHSGQHPSPEKTYPKNRMFINSPLPLPSWSTSLKFLKIEKKGGGFYYVANLWLRRSQPKTIDILIDILLIEAFTVQCHHIYNCFRQWKKIVSDVNNSFLKSD